MKLIRNLHLFFLINSRVTALTHFPLHFPAKGNFSQLELSFSTPLLPLGLRNSCVPHPQQAADVPSFNTNKLRCILSLQQFKDCFDTELSVWDLKTFPWRQTDPSKTKQIKAQKNGSTRGLRPAWLLFFNYFWATFPCSESCIWNHWWSFLATELKNILSSYPNNTWAISPIHSSKKRSETPFFPPQTHHPQICHSTPQYLAPLCWVITTKKGGLKIYFSLLNQMQIFLLATCFPSSPSPAQPAELCPGMFSGRCQGFAPSARQGRVPALLF